MGSYTERLRNRLRGGPDKGPGKQNTEREPAPSVKIDFWFSRHSTAHDAEAMRPQFDQADVFVPEVLGYTAKQLERLQKVSDGTLTPAQALADKDEPLNNGAHMAQELQMLANSHKLVMAIDQYYYKELLEEQYKEDYFHRFALGELLAGQTDRAANLTMHTFVSYANRQVAREKLMVENLQKRLGDTSFQQWAKQRLGKTGHPDIRVLVKLGASHTNVAYSTERKSQHAVETHFPEKPFVMEPMSAQFRRFVFDKVNRFDKQMAYPILAQQLTGTFIQAIIPAIEVQRVDPNGVREAMLGHQVGKILTVDVLNTIAPALERITPPINPSDYAKTRSLTVGQLRQVFNIVYPVLAQQGLRFPTTADELSQIK